MTCLPSVLRQMPSLLHKAGGAVLSKGGEWFVKAFFGLSSSGILSGAGRALEFHPVASTAAVTALATYVACRRPAPQKPVSKPAITASAE
jgi:hypothetical protein